MNQRRTGFATRDRVIGDFLRAVGNVRVAVLYRIAVYRSLDDYFLWYLSIRFGTRPVSAGGRAHVHPI
jgi:hypothetical protein